MLRVDTPSVRAHLPLRLVECRPNSFCPQSGECARRDRKLFDRQSRAVDGMALHVGCFCPLFIDRRGAALLETAC